MITVVGLGLLLVLSFLIAAVILIGGYATQYVVNVWGTGIKKKEVSLPLFWGIVIGLFVSSFTMPAAAITWIVMRFL